MQSSQNIKQISKITDNIYLGSYFSLKKINELNELKISCIINCAAEVSYEESLEIMNNDTIKKYNYELTDDENNDVKKNFDIIVDKIHQLLENGEIIFIHCAMGISRAPAITIYYLMKYHKKTYLEAYDIVKTKRAIININPYFIKNII